MWFHFIQIFCDIYPSLGLSVSAWSQALLTPPMFAILDNFPQMHRTEIPWHSHFWSLPPQCWPCRQLVACAWSQHRAFISSHACALPPSFVSLILLLHFPFTGITKHFLEQLEPTVCIEKQSHCPWSRLDWVSSKWQVQRAGQVATPPPAASVSTSAPAS